MHFFVLLDNWLRCAVQGPGQEQELGQITKPEAPPNPTNRPFGPEIRASYRRAKSQHLADCTLGKSLQGTSPIKYHKIIIYMVFNTTYIEVFHKYPQIRN